MFLVSVLPVKESSESPLVRPCTKPTGVVTPSPKLIPLSTSPPPPPRTNSYGSSRKNSFELRKNATPTTKPSIIVTPTPQPLPTTPTLQPSTPMTKPPSIPQPHKFTPRSVLKSKQAPDNNKKPQIAYVIPMAPSKPVARVPPSPQMIPEDTSKQSQTDSSDHWNVSDVSTMYGPTLPPDYIQGSSLNWKVTSILPEKREEKIKVFFKKHQSTSHQSQERESSTDTSSESEINEREKQCSSKHKVSEGESSDIKRRREKSSSSEEDEEVERKKRKYLDHKRKHKKHHRHHSSPQRHRDTDSDFEISRKHRHLSPERSHKRHGGDCSPEYWLSHNTSTERYKGKTFSNPRGRKQEEKRQYSSGADGGARKYKG